MNVKGKLSSVGERMGNSIMKPTKHCSKSRGEDGGELRGYNGRGECVKVYCMHLWHYHNETLYPISYDHKK